jgi:hypothetical protein
MRLSRDLAAILAGLSFGLLIGGWSNIAAGAEEGTAQSIPPAAEQSAAEASTPVAEEDTEAAEAPAPAAEEATEAAQTVSTVLPAGPPPSLQTLVDQRRDMLRKRRKAMFDALTGRYAYMPPGWAAYEDGMERYRDAMRALYRQQRDYSRLHHDAWSGAYSPWSRAQREWSQLRSYLIQMDQLDRQERRDAYAYTQPWGFGGPVPW